MVIELYFEVSFFRTKEYPMAEATATHSIQIPKTEASTSPPLLNITSPTPNIETRIPNKFIRVIFSLRKYDDVKDVNNGMVAITTAVNVDETNLIP